MEATFKINTDFLSIDLIDNIKKMFPHKEVEITVHPSDTTEFIKSNPAYEQELLQRINDYKAKQEGISLKAEELL
jgi:hypothetical protein